MTRQKSDAQPNLLSVICYWLSAALVGAILPELLVPSWPWFTKMPLTWVIFTATLLMYLRISQWIGSR